MTNGFNDHRIIEIYLDLASVHSPALRVAAVGYYCHGLSSSEVSRRHGVDRRNLLRVRKSVDDVIDKINSINRYKCGLE
jgi:hypothetical protein